MNRINALRTTTQNSAAPSHARSTTQTTPTNLAAAASPLIFAAVLLFCSLAVGCSSDQAKSNQAKNDQPNAANTTPATPAAFTPPAPTLTTPTPKSPHKKVTRKAPPTLTYSDPTTGVSFQYPPKDSLKTSSSATDLVASTPTPMDFVQPGGTVVAAVALPPTAYPNSNLASAFFNVSVNKSLTADQCSEFSVPQPNPASPTDPAIQAAAQVTAAPVTNSKLMIGDLELQSSEPATAQSTTPTHQTAKYFHVFQNQSCYEFALQVSTNKTDSTTNAKPVDPDQVFSHLEQILATVKITPAAAPPVSATSQPPTTTSQPAQ
jgi:hypothetical protein